MVDCVICKKPINPNESHLKNPPVCYDDKPLLVVAGVPVDTLWTLDGYAEVTISDRTINCYKLTEKHQKRVTDALIERLVVYFPADLVHWDYKQDITLRIHHFYAYTESGLAESIAVNA